MADMNTCGTCKHWKKTYQSTNAVGDCTRISCFVAGDSAVLLVPPCKCHPDAPQRLEVQALSTTDAFGCLWWQLHMNG